MAVWQSIRVDRDAACTLLGMRGDLAEMIGGMQLTEFNAIADRHADHLAPRWADSPVIWRKLLLAAASERGALMREFDLHALQLLSADAMSREPRAHREEIRVA